MEADAKDGRSKDARQGAADSPRLFYVPRKDATPEGELAALAAVYAFVIQAQEKKETAAALDEDVKEVDTKRRRSGQGQ